MKRYDIWRANVRFEDSPEVKARPVLIIGSAAYIIAYKITGTDRGDELDEYRIRYWHEAGLVKESSVRINKAIKLVKGDMIEKVGELDERDRLILEFRLMTLQ